MNDHLMQSRNTQWIARGDRYCIKTSHNYYLTQDPSAPSVAHGKNIPLHEAHHKVKYKSTLQYCNHRQNPVASAMHACPRLTPSATNHAGNTHQPVANLY